MSKLEKSLLEIGATLLLFAGMFLCAIAGMWSQLGVGWQMWAHIVAGGFVLCFRDGWTKALWRHERERVAQLEATG